MKKALIAVAALVLVILIVAVIAPFVIDLNQYKGQILAKVRPAVHRDVDFESIELTVLTGLGAELEGLRVPENPRFAADDFVTLDSLQVRLKILPLLKGEVQVSELVFKKPVVRIRRNAQGEFNFQDMIPEAPAEAPPKAEKPGPPAEPQPPSVLAAFGVGELTVRDATVVYEDRTAAEGAPSEPKTLTVSRLDASIENISLFDAVSFTIEGSLFDEPGRNFQITGQVGPLGREMDFMKTPLNVAVRTDPLPLMRLTESLSLPVSALSGTLNVDISAAGSLNQNMDASSKIALKDLILQMKGDGQAGPQKTGKIALNLDGRALYTAAGETVTLEGTSLEVNGNRLDLTGKAQNVLSKPVWNMTARSASLDPSSLIRLFPMYAGKMPPDLSFKGPAKLEIRSSGSPDDFGVEAGMDMNLMEIAYGEVFAKPAGVALNLESAAGVKGEVVTVRSLELALYNLLLSGSGRMNLKGQAPTADIKIASKPFTLKGWDAIVPMLAQYQPDGSIGAITAGLSGPLDNAALNARASAERIAFTLPATEGQETSEGPQKGSVQDVSLDITGNTRPGGIEGAGTLNAGSGNFADIALSKVSADFRYAGNKLDVPQFSLGVFNGTISGSASYNTGTKDWAFSPVFKQVDAGRAVDALTTFKDVFDGTLSGNVRVKGSAETPGLASLSAQGEASIKKGTLNNVDLAQSVAEGFSVLEGIGGLLDTGQEEVQRNRETSFDSLDARFAVAQKTLTLQSFELTNIRTGKSTDSIAHLKGDVGLETKALDLSGDITLSQRHSERLIKQTPAIEALADAKKRVVLPITITGTMTRPKVSLKTSEIQKAMADFYVKKGVEKGMEKLKERLGIPQENQGTDKVIEDLFDGIFKK